MYVFLKNNMGMSIKNTRSTDFCADGIDVITNFAIIMNAVIKRVYCIISILFCVYKMAAKDR